MMSLKPKVSVVIPCYNMGDYVGEAIESVLSYPQQDTIEIIVVDDGSNDQGYTASVLKRYESFPNVTVVYQVNKGLGAARNKGFELSKAPYVLPLDADNKIHAEYLDAGLLELDSNPGVGVVYGDLMKFGEASYYSSVGAFDISKVLVKNYIDACVLMRKEAYLSVGGYDEVMPVMGYEDWDLHLRLYFNGWTFRYLPTLCFYYRVRAQSMLQTSNEHRSELVNYMFTKPELQQAKLLRDALVERDALKKVISRKGLQWALKTEAVVKKTLVFRWLKKNKIL